MKYAPQLIRPPRLSPLRYPGGKQLLAPYIAGVIEENFFTGCKFYEPFAGGAAVSLELLRLGYIDTAVLIERDPLIYSFWWCVCNRPDELIKAISDVPVTLEKWHELLPLREIDIPNLDPESILELGLAGLFFNRTNFSGVISAGPIGGISQSSKYKIDCRFNKSSTISSLQEISKFSSRLDVKYGDSIAWLQKNKKSLQKENSFIYIDPPYHGQGKRLYRHHFTDTQHIALANTIKSAEYPWLLSYDDTPFIRSLYSSTKLQPIYLDHSVKSSRVAQEIVLSNLEIPPPVYEGYSSAELSRPTIDLI